MDELERYEAPLARSPDASARLAGCGRTKIFEALKNGDLAAYKWGRKTLILDADLRHWLAALPRREVA
jgi:excisionase family DNA binding protein